jgi:hypothetical protein
MKSTKGRRSTPLSRGPSAARARSDATALSVDSEAGETDFLELDERAEPDDRFLFELRRKYRNQKGKGMWDDIQRDYGARYKPMKKEALQMKISRAVAKWGKWPDEEASL